MKSLSDEGMDFRMIFVGGGADAEELMNTVTKLGLGSKVFFTGPVHDREALRAYNTRADLFLFPSTYDTNGIVVREAAACGLASVLIRGSCAAEGITHGRNGYVIEENARAMAGLLKDVCTDMNAVHQVGE
ncbi:glycosyltransferase, partial [Vibrio sp. FNV 38]|nr:glycosyltransferase [Vibrio sp. FNV 38]